MQHHTTTEIDPDFDALAALGHAMGQLYRWPVSGSPAALFNSIQG
jgi:hypothetical protein